MITDINGFREQTPDVEGNWLYQEIGDDRVFIRYTALGKTDEPRKECTNEEKEQWEREHPQSEPEQESVEQPTD